MQLQRAEAQSAQLQTAASRAADKLQEQAMKERALEARLSGVPLNYGDAGRSAQWVASAILSTAAGVNGVVSAATGRCMRKTQEAKYERQADQDVSPPLTPNGSSAPLGALGASSPRR
mmetsp:Transcript_91972/g.256054  ORF Transcript_91972/g.256054 Transcript_91972/m.256054 type:complete len:118 (-) Transcript_91972:43-396(-)